MDSLLSPPLKRTEQLHSGLVWWSLGRCNASNSWQRKNQCTPVKWLFVQSLLVKKRPAYGTLLLKYKQVCAMSDDLLISNHTLAFRMSRQRRAYRAKRAAVVLIESAARGYLVRKSTKVDLEKRMKILAEDESRMPPEEQARRQKLREEEAKKVFKLRHLRLINVSVACSAGGTITRRRGSQTNGRRGCQEGTR